MKAILIIGVGILFVVGASLMIFTRHHQQPSTDASSSAIASIPTPTGGGDSSDLKSPNVPLTDAKKVEDEDAKNAREQNWKADHVQPAGPGDSNVTAEDMQELQDTEKPSISQSTGRSDAAVARDLRARGEIVIATSRGPAKINDPSFPDSVWERTC